MSATAVTPHVHSALGRLNFPRVVRSEWIKLISLRSTFWTLISVMAVVIGFAALVSTVLDAPDPAMPEAIRSSQLTAAATAGLAVAQLVVAVLGVLVIGGEFSTGMIRSSFAAVPRRFPVLAAKAIVLFLVSFVIGLVSATASWAIAIGALTSKGYSGELLSESTLWNILGGGASLGLVAVFALGIGTIVKSTAGGLAIALGALFVLPVLVQLTAVLTKTEWVLTVSYSLIGSAGSGMAGVDNGDFGPWQNLLIVAAWAIVPFIAGAILLQRRDT